MTDLRAKIPQKSPVTQRPCTRSGPIAASLLAAVCLVAAFLTVTTALSAQESRPWRPATPAELAALIPPRAPVEKERIETELRTASGITDGHGRFIVGVVLITAGYSAEGKYSHFLIAQAPLMIGQSLLPPGEYLLGWQRREDSLNVTLYEAASGKLVAQIEATRNPSITRVESFRIYPPGGRSVIQIGRFAFAYKLAG